ncbi:MAG: hypothetical protein QXR44_03345 [Thermoproteota archaeon]
MFPRKRGEKPVEGDYESEQTQAYSLRTLTGIEVLDKIMVKMTNPLSSLIH